MPANIHEEFLQSIPLLDSFFQAANPDHYISLPNNWFIAVTDIENSTEAIEKGNYRSVNILGASPIAALLNLFKEKTLPYSFGGDGSLVCIPPQNLKKVRRVLATCRQIGLQEFDLKLRAALIPADFIRQNEHEIQIARFRVSGMYKQAIFRGGGLAFAEEILKNNAPNEFSITEESSPVTADFSGLECRWKEVGPKNKRVITMLVKSNPNHPTGKNIYAEVLHKLKELFDFDGKTNPIDTDELSMNISVSELMREVKVRTFGKSFWGKLAYLLKVELQTFFGKVFMKLGYKSSATDWSLYKSDVALNSDHRKFDDMLRLVISGTDVQFKKLTEFLDNQYQASKLAYGTQITDKAIFTCMVFKYHRDHVHFVDGSGGGYVLAAKQLKKRLEKLKQKSKH